MAAICDGADCLGIGVDNSDCHYSPLICHNGNPAVRTPCRPNGGVSSFAVNNAGTPLVNDPGAAAALTYPNNPDTIVALVFGNTGCDPMTWNETIRFTFSLVQGSTGGINYYFQHSNDYGVTWFNDYAGRIYGQVSQNVYLPFNQQGRANPGQILPSWYRLLVFREPLVGSNQPLLYEATGLYGIQHATRMADC